nr:DNA-directed DNA polymerase [Tanacetum cinerariifolium]
MEILPMSTSDSTTVGTSFGFHPFQFSYPTRKLTMEEMLYKFIDKGRREHKEMGAFIREFKTTNELLLKERNNSLSELKFEARGGLHGNNNERYSAILLNKLPSKEKDPRSFTIPCDIGHLYVSNALADLGASISLMPYMTYEKLDLGEPKPTRMSLELVDRETISSHRSEESIHQFDLESCDDGSEFEIPIQRIKQRNASYSESHETKGTERTQNKHLYSASANEIDEKRLELKDLPSHLEYVYLKGNESCSVIISSKLTEKEKISLLRVLEKRKGEIAWKMSDIKGISSSFCTQKILMEESFNLVIQPRQRLNPKVQDVVKMKSLGFFQISIAPEDPEKTTFTCPYGTLAYRRMLFGLCNAPTTFERCMTAIFHDMVEDFMEAFMDDFL